LIIAVVFFGLRVGRHIPIQLSTDNARPIQIKTKVQDETYQNATTACEETSSVPATIAFVSGLQATDRTGDFFARQRIY
jgi:hypothetical protein